MTFQTAYTTTIRVGIDEFLELVGVPKDAELVDLHLWYVDGSVEIKIKGNFTDVIDLGKDDDGTSQMHAQG